MFFELNGISFDYEDCTFDKIEILNNTLQDADGQNARAITNERTKRNGLIADFIYDEAIGTGKNLQYATNNIKTFVINFKLGGAQNPITLDMINGVDLEDDRFYRYYNNPKTEEEILSIKFWKLIHRMNDNYIGRKEN